MSLAYRKNGQGAAVVFLHGFCENKDVWKAFEARLAGQYQTIAIDLPGFGESTGNGQYRSVDDMAREVHTTLRTLDVTSCVVIGHSLGGYVTLALAELFPSVIRGLGLFHSTAYPDSEEKKQNRNKTADFIERNGIAAFLDNFVPSLFFAGRKAELAHTIQSYRELTLQTPVQTAAAVTLAMRDRPDRTPVLSKATYPVMFIAGKEDTAVPLSASREQFFLPAFATIHLLPQTGHMGMYERESETVAMVEDFVRLVSIAEATT